MAESVAIKIETFENPLPVWELSAQVGSNKLNEKGIKDEHLDEPESIIYEENGIKNEDKEEDQSVINNFNENEIKDEYFEEPQFISHEEIDIKTSDDEEGCFNNRSEETTANTGGKKYSCDKCSYETGSKRYLIGHILKHDKVNTPNYSCNQCSYKTIDNSALITHLRTHSCFGLICILCQKSFKRKDNLDAHYVSQHRDRSDKWGSTITNKIYECPKCLYKTVRANHFKDHLAAHEPAGQAQFQCDICGYKCKYKSYFMRHLRLHVGRLPLACTECYTRFNTKQQLDSHVVSRHSDNKELISNVTCKVHQCEKCDYKTVRSSNFKIHLKRCL